MLNARSHVQRGHEGVQQRFLDGYAVSRVEREHPSNQVQGLRSSVGEQCFHRTDLGGVQSVNSSSASFNRRGRA